MSIDWKPFVALVNSHQRFLLVSHIRPDCDALGSELGMAGVLAALGKDVRIVNGNATPQNLAFIDPHKRIKQIGADVRPEQLEDVQVLIVLDTSAWAQLGDMGEVIKTTKAKKLVIDHHKSEDDLGATQFKHIQAEATGRLVYEAACALGVSLTPEIATPLFAALATDTGWFRFSNTSAATYELAAKFVEAGAKPDWIYAELYERDTLARLNLRGRLLARTKVEMNGRLAYTSVLKEDFEETGALPPDTEDAINLTLGVSGVEVAVIFVWQKSGGYKISFRSRSGVDCSKLAEQFKGGGHKAAAGAYLEGALDQVQPKVLEAVRKAMG